MKIQFVTLTCIDRIPIGKTVITEKSVTNTDLLFWRTQRRYLLQKTKMSLSRFSSRRYFRGSYNTKRDDGLDDLLHPTRRRKRDVVKSWFQYQVPTAETATLVTTGTMTDKSINSSDCKIASLTSSSSEYSIRYEDNERVWTLDPQAVDSLENRRSQPPVDDSTWRTYQNGIDIDLEDVEQHESFHTRYDHSYTIDPPPRFLSKNQHAKWERSQMLRHTASRYLMKNKRSQIMEEPSSATTFRSKPTVADETVSQLNSFSEVNTTQEQKNNEKVYKKENQLVANVSTFFKSMGSFFTTSSSPTKEENQVNGEHGENDNSKTLRIKDTTSNENNNITSTSIKYGNLNLFSPSCPITPDELPRQLHYDDTHIIENYNQSFQF